MDIAEGVAAAVSLAAERSEPALLDRIVHVARDLTGAQYAAALLLGPDGQPSGLAHTGMTAEQVAVLPHLPRPVGLIATVLRGETLRLDSLADHPDSVGFPAKHVPMTAMLGTPIRADGRVIGGLYLTRAPDRGRFTETHERAAAAVAEQVGIVVGGLRDRLATNAVLSSLSMLDPEARDGRRLPGLSPSDGSRVIRRLLAGAREVLGMELAFLARIADDQQTISYVDAPASALPLGEGLTVGIKDTYCALMLDGAIEHAVPDVAANPLLSAMPATAALGLGAYCGVPVTLPDGTAHGTLCGLSSRSTTPPSPVDFAALRVIAGLVGVVLARQQEQEAHRSELGAAFAPFLRDDRLQIQLQPIVDLRTGDTSGFEALSRFTDENGAARGPAEVFAQAAELGLSLRLEEAAVRTALRLLQELPDGTYLSINLSPQAVLEPAIYAVLTDAVQRAPGRLVMELTEHEQVPDYPALLDALHGLRLRGLRLAVDDTGSGFASLQHVTRLRPDIVKLDIAFVRDVHLDPSRRAVARSLTGFSTDIGATLIAEGIESQAELDELLRLGVPCGQGYHLGRPAPALEVLQTPARHAGQDMIGAAAG